MRLCRKIAEPRDRQSLRGKPAGHACPWGRWSIERAQKGRRAGMGEDLWHHSRHEAPGPVRQYRALRAECRPTCRPREGRKHQKYPPQDIDSNRPRLLIGGGQPRPLSATIWGHVRRRQSLPAAACGPRALNATRAEDGRTGRGRLRRARLHPRDSRGPRGGGGLD